MEDNKYYFQKMADELRKRGIEIDELRAKALKAKAGSSAKPVNQNDELPAKIETARDNLIQIFFSIRGQESRE